MSGPAEKAAARAALVEKYSRISREDAEKRGLHIFENLTALPEYRDAGAILIYVSVGREPDTHRIIDHALSLGKTVAVPLCMKGGAMEFRVIGGLSELRSDGRYGIPKPPEGAAAIYAGETDLAVVPALAFDETGFRLGRGGGYSDRFLAGTAAKCAGLAYSDFILPVPKQAHDMPVGRVVTEHGVLTCR